MARITFLAPDDLGETVLASGAVAHALTGGGDELTIVGGGEAAALFRAAPVERVLVASEKPLNFAIAARLHAAQCDTLIDAQGGVAGAITPAGKRVRIKPGAVLRHLTEAWGEAACAGRALAPKLWIDEAARSEAAEIAPDAGPLLIVAPGGVTHGKRWPQERFAAVARRLASGPLARVVVLGAAARDAEIARAIVSSLDADGVAARDIGRGVDLLAAAALMERATLCIGNDNALTHVAAAVGAPTLTLFGPTDERLRAPYGPRARTLRGRSLEAIAASPAALDGTGAMGDISIDAVEAAALELLHAGGLR